MKNLKQLPVQMRANRWKLTSLALHVALLCGLLIHRAPQIAKPTQRGDRNGHLLSLTFDPGTGAPAAALQASKAPPLPPVQHALSQPTPAVKSVPPAAAATATSSSDSGGSDTLGAGNLTLALVLSHPYPSPSLPSGTSGDVIVDVVIDKDGLVAKYSLVRGLGHSIDDTVIATIQTWTFKPATRNGQPVASEQELLFHYEKS